MKGINPILLVILISTVSLVGLMWYLKVGPFAKGEVGIDLYLLYEDGRTEPIQEGTAYTFNVVQAPFSIYYGGAKVTGIRASLWVQPSVEGLSGDVSLTMGKYINIVHPDISYIVDAVQPINKTVPQNVKTSNLETLTLDDTDFGDRASADCLVRFWFQGRGTVGGYDDNFSAVADVNVKWAATGLTIVSGIDVSTFRIIIE